MKTVGQNMEGWMTAVKCLETGGMIYADLFMGNSAISYSKNGYAYAMEKADTTVGWSFTVFEEVFN